MLGTVDVTKSEASNPLDKIRIFEEITQTFGFTQLNAKVVECLRDWIIRDMISYISNVPIKTKDELIDIIDCRKVLGSFIRIWIYITKLRLYMKNASR
mmetsp:Transcript_22253/g.31968  ORF Transcript_22253/g.31968 Transcript_22253/m.31968 type:complete len:98 (+) Transcript_22253:584-877(+)